MTLAVRACLLLLCVACATSAHAQVPVPATADLAITASASPSTPLRPGQTLRISLVVRNNGPEVASSVGVRTSEYLFGRFARFHFYPVAPSVCQVAFDDFLGGIGEPDLRVGTIFFGPLAPGQTRECTFEVLAAAGATGTYDFEFNVSGVLLTDAVVSNNQAVVGISFVQPEPRRIPTLQLATLALLSALVLLLASGTTHLGLRG